MELPNNSEIIQNIQRDSDERGDIISIVDQAVMNVSIITCKQGSLRSNHYHMKDFHFMYVLDGEIDYFYRKLNSSEISYLKVKTGDNIFTPAKEWHATYFPMNTVLIVSSRFARDRETYEKDTVREVLITKDNINDFMPRITK